MRDVDVSFVNISANNDDNNKQSIGLKFQLNFGQISCG